LPARKAPFWLLFAGVVINVILIAVAGFWVMLACSLWAVASYRRMTGSTTRRVSARRAGKKRRAAKERPAGKQAGSGLMGWRSAGGVARRAAANANFHQTNPPCGSGELVAEGSAAPPGHGNRFGQGWPSLDGERVSRLAGHGAGAP